MKHQKNNAREELDQAVAALRAEDPAAEALEGAGERVWQRLSQEATASEGRALGLQSIRGCSDVRDLLPQYRAGRLAAARALLVEAHLHECVACRREAETGKPAPSAALPWNSELPRVSNNSFRWALAAAAVIVIGISAYWIQDRVFGAPAGMRARVESLSGGLYRVGFSGEQPLQVGDELQEGENVRTSGGARAMLRLRDGSLVEMNERSQFAVSLHRHDTTVVLDRGNIIVQAAKRQSGYLYVAAKDCRVSVTGTVFSVNSGMKGSRVSVIEGEVRVAGAGGTQILHPGDQLSTSASVAAVPVTREIAWSQNREQHLALLAEFVRLANKLETVQMPGLRYQSNLLPLLPGDTVLYGSIPNLGDAVQQANQLFQQELEESQVLRDWWQQVQAHRNGPNFQEVIGEIHTLSGYLGDEIVFAVAFDAHRGSPLVLAQIKKPGLKEFIAQAYPNQPNLQVLDEQQLNALPAQQHEKGLLILVRPDFVAASSDVATLQQLDAALRHGSGGFAGTGFGQRMTQAYQHGAGLLFGADLEEMAAQHAATSRQGSERHRQVFAQTGLADVEYLVAERKEINGHLLNHAELSFSGPRRGMASWLAAPAPIGGLDYVSKDAAAVAAFVAKSPAKMLDDALNVAYSSNPNAQTDLARGESELKIKFHQDLADTLGGEVTLALDGPILPTPSWKVIAEVYDPARLQSTIQQLVADVNGHAQPGQGMALEQETVNGLKYYTLRSQDATKHYEVTYTFTNGYMILGPSRALVMQALSIRASGNSLGQSGDFKALLPHDDHANVSALLYQNLAPVLGPITQQLSPSQLQSLQQLAAETKPSVVCAYGEDNSIRVASTSRFFGLDLNTLALSSLMKLAQPGAMRAH